MPTNKTTVGISRNGRYFVDGQGHPLFWLGDTQWNLFRSHTVAEARTILENRRAQGFNFIQVMLLGVAFGPAEAQAKAVVGEAFPSRNPAAPNQDYFKQVDAIVELARRLGLILVVGLDHPNIKLVDRHTARAFGRFVGARYRHVPNLVWVASYAVPQEENLVIMRELAQGLEEGDQRSHLITNHPDPALPVASSGLVHNEGWLAFNSIQTFSSAHLIYDTVTADYRRRPAKPVVMAEGAYEDGPEYGYPITPYVIRKQAYWTYLAGGHHSYGHNDNWRVSPTWQTTLDAPGAVQMSVLKKIFLSFAWWDLVPDQTVLTAGAGSGHTLNAAARDVNGHRLVIYASTAAPFSVRMDCITQSPHATAAWIDLVAGNRQVIGSFPASGVRTFTPVPKTQDSLLLIEAAL